MVAPVDSVDGIASGTASMSSLTIRNLEGSTKIQLGQGATGSSSPLA
jgi:hypothetical protein